MMTNEQLKNWKSGLIQKLESPAKINLFLNLVGKRADGYHLLESYFALLQLADTISLYEADENFCHIENGAQIKDNLCLKAVELFQQEFGMTNKIGVSIIKRIPLGGGLGGGSSNCAAVLKFLNKYSKVNLDLPSLAAFSLKLGADVPFFIYGQNAFVSGIGEIIKPLTLGVDLPLLMLNPGIHIDTTRAFQKFKNNFVSSMESTPTNILKAIYLGNNSLQPGVVKFESKVATLLDELMQQEGVKFVRMSGSGASCFAVFEDMDRCTQAASKLNKYGWLIHKELLKI